MIVVSGNLVGAGAAFAAAIIAARVLPIDQFAAFGVGLAVNSLAVQFADFGLGTIAVAERADSTSAESARAKARALTLHRVRTAAAVGLLITLVVVLLPPLAPYRAAAILGASGEIFGSLALFFVWCLQGEHNFGIAASIQATQGLLRLALVGVCAVAGLGAAPMMVGYAILAPGVVAAIGAVALFTRPISADLDAPDPEAPEVDVDRRRVLAIAGVLAAMAINFDLLLLTALADEHQVAIYAAAWRFGSGVLLINTAIASALLPFIVAADDAWKETKQLVRLGLMVAAGWLLLVPLMAVVGPLLLGTIGSEARTALILLLIAFALDGFYFVLFQIYLRVRKERLLLGAMALEFSTMVTVTLLLRGEGALAPAIGQLVARVLVCALVAAPVVLAAIGRCSWFQASIALPPWKSSKA
jgi:O-antigen/teichoic acid export membrane protein